MKEPSKEEKIWKKREMHHRSLGREELRRAGSLVFPNSNGRDQRGGI
jgi:hypothetical protein